MPFGEFINCMKGIFVTVPALIFVRNYVTVDRERKSEVALIFCLQLQTEYTREVLPHGPPVD
jgi:hypothetical protein